MAQAKYEIETCKSIGNWEDSFDSENLELDYDTKKYGASSFKTKIKLAGNPSTILHSCDDTTNFTSVDSVEFSVNEETYKTDNKAINITRSPYHVTNNRFEDGLEGWEKKGDATNTLESGGHHGDNCLRIVGEGTQSGAELSSTIAQFTNKIIRTVTYIKREANAIGGTAYDGLYTENSIRISHDEGGAVTTEWQRFENIFLTPTNTTNIKFILGAWHVDGEMFFDEVMLNSTTPTHYTSGNLELSYQEKIISNVYTFDGSISLDELGKKINYSRPIQIYENVGWNTDRYDFSSNGILQYHFNIDNNPQTKGTLKFYIPFYSYGDLEVEISFDNSNWTSLGTFNSTGQKEISLSFTEKEDVYIRFTSSGTIQLRNVYYTTNLKNSVSDVEGTTTFSRATNTGFDIHFSSQNFKYSTHKLTFWLYFKDQETIDKIEGLVFYAYSPTDAGGGTDGWNVWKTENNEQVAFPQVGWNFYRVTVTRPETTESGGADTSIIEKFRIRIYLKYSYRSETWEEGDVIIDEIRRYSQSGYGSIINYNYNGDWSDRSVNDELAFWTYIPDTSKFYKMELSFGDKVAGRPQNKASYEFFDLNEGWNFCKVKISDMALYNYTIDLNNIKQLRFTPTYTSNTLSNTPFEPDETTEIIVDDLHIIYDYPDTTLSYPTSNKIKTKVKLWQPQ